MENFNQVLIISGIGMGLVFLSILFMWWLMELLVKFIKDKPESVDQGENQSLDMTSQQDDIRRKAAAAAVAIALMRHEAQSSQDLKSSSQTASLQTSTWQAVMRATEREKQTQFHYRRPRG